MRNCTSRCLVLLYVRNQTEEVIRMIEQVENLYPEINFLVARNDIKISIYNKSYVHRSVTLENPRVVLRKIHNVSVLTLRRSEQHLLLVL